jgi:predicted nucleic acid-binding protein
MIKVFVDSDIILDLLAQREPYYQHAAKLFTLIDPQKVKGFTSPLVFANLHYLLRIKNSNNAALKSLRKLKIMLNIIPIDEKVIEQSLNSEFTDFEDAIQYFTALNFGIDYIITRNLTDYKKSAIPVSTAEAFINNWAVK